MAKKILILEDDHFLSKAYTTILTKEGYEVEHAEDGVKGLELVKDNVYDLILLDMLMPRLGGIEFLRVFQPKEHLETKVIIFSNMSTPNTVQEAMALGAVKYLTKATFSPREMVELIKETIG